MEESSTRRPADADLVAYIDGELSPEQARWIEIWLARDGELRERRALLARGGRPFGKAFEPLLAGLPGYRPPDRPVAAGRPAGAHAWARLGLVAAGILLFVAGALFQRSLPELREAIGMGASDEGADEWREAAAEYVSLYTPETLSAIPDDMAPRERELAIIGKRLGVALPLASLSLPGLALKRVQLLQYDGKPLAQIAYLDPQNGPLVLCIYSGGGSDSAPASERRNELNIVHWVSRGRAFMLIGHVPKSRLQQLASVLSQRLTL